MCVSKILYKSFYDQYLFFQEILTQNKGISAFAQDVIELF